MKAIVITKTQMEALKALRDHGGEGVFEKRGRLLARGVVLGESATEEYMGYSRATWKALIKAGIIEYINKYRVRIKPDVHIKE